ncbi:MAG TPA: LCP family protein [Armatimonadota bacterium]|nr:LCP family protein [Armatimonadota bacterium]
MAKANTRKQGRRRWLWLLVPVVLIGLPAGAGWWYLQHLGLRPGGQMMGMFRPPFHGLKRVNVLILGVDNDADAPRSDTIMVAALDLSQRTIGILSVPRDFRVAIPGHDAKKINAAYTLGGAALTDQAVEALTGVRSDYHVTVASGGLARLVDALGGVEIDVDKRMYYRDRRGGLLINLRPGLQRLNGEQAVGYVRYRHDAMGDLTRIRRQQLFVRALTREAFAPRNLARLPRLLKVVSEAVETDLTIRDLEAMADLGKTIDPEHIKARTLPGTPITVAGISYLEPDYQELSHVVKEVLYGARPRVAIINATEVPGVERGLVRRLGAEEYEVTEVRIANYAAATSEVIDRADHEQEAAEIRGWLECGKVIQAPGEAIAGADITVLLGTDYIGK